MKKTFTFFAAMAMLASVSFAQNGKLLRQAAQRMVIAPGNFQKATKATKDANCDPITAMPWEEGFENGTDCWTFTQAHDTMGFVAYPNNSQYQYAHTGSYCLIGVYNDNYNVSQWAVSPAITLPDTADEFTLSYFVEMTSFEGIATNYEVLLSTGSADTASFTTVLLSENTVTSRTYVKRTISLANYAGQTIRIAFHNKTAMRGDAMFLDDIRIGGPTLPELTLAGPIAARINVPTTFIATSDLSTFEWFVNDIQVEGEVSDTLHYTFDAVGTYQVVAQVSNSVGSASDTIEVEAFSCDDIVLPYTPNFNKGLGCWDTRSDSTESGWFASVDMFADTPIGQVLSISAYDPYGIGLLMDIPVDNWLISPEITMPASGTHEIAWQVKPIDSDYDGDHYGVYAISGTDTILLYEETLNGMTDTAFTQRIALIPDSITGTFQVAFRHFDCADGYVIILDSIQLRNLTAPVLSLVGPVEVENGNTAVYTATCGNAQSLIWTINGDDDNTNGNTMTHTFSADGFYTVAVTATNSEGTSTDSIITEVYTCNAITEFPYIQNFESSTRCWTMVSMDPANDNLFGIDTTRHSGNYGFRFSSYSTAENYNQYLISPELTLSNDNTMMVKFWYKAHNNRETFSVLSSNTTKEVAAFTNVLGTYSTTATEWTEVALLIPEGTKYIAINYNANFRYYLYIDDIVIEELNIVPTVTIEGPTTIEAGESVTYVATAPLATSFEWSIDGNTSSENSNTLTTSFDIAGNHTVQVVGINSVGRSAAATLTVNVFSCDAVTEFPWIEDFEDATGYDCWKFIDADGDGYNWTTDYLRTSSTPAAHNGSRGMAASASYASAPLHPDNWMILPAMTLPEGSNLILSWFEKGQDVNDFAEKYSVYISTTGRQISDFTAAAYTTTTRNEWKGNNLELAQYAGQTIYIAFRHYDCTNMFYLDIDDIKVSNERVGIDDIDNHILSLYPNPASQMVAVNAEGIEGNVTVQIVDLNGRVMMQQQGAAQSFRFDVSTLAQGAYFVRMTGENINAVRKLIVK